MSAAATGHAEADPSSLPRPSSSSYIIAESQSSRRPVHQQMESAAQAQLPTSHNISSGAVVATSHATTTGDASPALSKQASRNSGKEKKTRSLDYVLRSGLAGGLAGCAGKTVVAPLDRVKILFQASNPQFAKYTGSWFGLVSAVRDIKRHEGARGLFRGHSATLLRIFPYAAIKFLAYEQIRAAVIPSRDKETPFRRLIAGSMAGMTSVFFTYPLELIRVRLAFETKKTSRSSLSGAIRQIYSERVSSPKGLSSGKGTSSVAAVAADTVASTTKQVVPSSGLANFYRGFTPTLIGMFPYAGVSFLTHDTVGDWLRSPALAPYTTILGSESASSGHTHSGSWRPQLTAAAELFSGAVAGLVSQTSSYPLEVVRRRMQVGGVVGDGRRLGIAETARTIFLERGLQGFWVGLGIGYLKMIPMTATSFFVYERAKWALGI